MQKRWSIDLLKMLKTAYLHGADLKGIMLPSTQKSQLHKAESALKILINKVERGCRRPVSRFHSYGIKKDKISSPNGLSTHPDFESGVCKIQQGIWHKKMLTREESNACNSLLKTYLDGIPTQEIENNKESNDSEDDIIDKQEKRKHQEIEGKSKYINCDFIMGSAAIVE